jgi:Ni/Fe-hydrogenase subunit HybB-like protein
MKRIRKFFIIALKIFILIDIIRYEYYLYNNHYFATIHQYIVRSLVLTMFIGVLIYLFIPRWCQHCNSFKINYWSRDYTYCEKCNKKQDAR